MKNLVIFGIVLAVILVPVLILGVMYMTYSNGEIRLRNQYTAQVSANESSFDKLWKTIKQQSGVANTERETFKNAYVEIMNAQKGIAGEGSLASFFTQAGINLSPDLFKQLMITIESQRESFDRDQKKLVEIKRMHDNALTTIPSSWFVGGRPELELKLITSDRTEEVFSEGKDNDISL